MNPIISSPSTTYPSEDGEVSSNHIHSQTNYNSIPSTIEYKGSVIFPTVVVSSTKNNNTTTATITDNNSLIKRSATHPPTAPVPKLKSIFKAIPKFQGNQIISSSTSSTASSSMTDATAIISLNTNERLNEHDEIIVTDDSSSRSHHDIPPPLSFFPSVANNVHSRPILSLNNLSDVPSANSISATTNTSHSNVSEKLTVIPTSDTSSTVHLRTMNTLSTPIGRFPSSSSSLSVSNSSSFSTAGRKLNTKQSLSIRSKSSSTDYGLISTNDSIIHVLAVDDSPSITKFLAKCLSKNNCIVTTASDAPDVLVILKERIALLHHDEYETNNGNQNNSYSTKNNHMSSPIIMGKREKVFDIILLDVLLPSMHGSELIESIRLLPPSASTIPIIMMSSVDETGMAELCLENGAEAYLQKPFTVQTVMSAIHTVFEKRRVLAYSDTLNENKAKNNSVSSETELNNDNVSLYRPFQSSSSPWMYGNKTEVYDNYDSDYSFHDQQDYQDEYEFGTDTNEEFSTNNTTSNDEPDKFVHEISSIKSMDPSLSNSIEVSTVVFGSEASHDFISPSTIGSENGRNDTYSESFSYTLEENLSVLQEFQASLPTILPNLDAIPYLSTMLGDEQDRSVPGSPLSKSGSSTLPLEASPVMSYSTTPATETTASVDDVDSPTNNNLRSGRYIPSPGSKHSDRSMAKLSSSGDYFSKMRTTTNTANETIHELLRALSLNGNNNFSESSAASSSTTKSKSTLSSDANLLYEKLIELPVVQSIIANQVHQATTQLRAELMDEFSEQIRTSRNIERQFDDTRHRLTDALHEAQQLKKQMRISMDHERELVAQLSEMRELVYELTNECSKLNYVPKYLVRDTYTGHFSKSTSNGIGQVPDHSLSSHQPFVISSSGKTVDVSYITLRVHDSTEESIATRILLAFGLGTTSNGSSRSSKFMLTSRGSKDNNVYDSVPVRNHTNYLNRIGRFRTGGVFQLNDKFPLMLQLCVQSSPNIRVKLPSPRISSLPIPQTYVSRNDLVFFRLVTEVCDLPPYFVDHVFDRIKNHGRAWYKRLGILPENSSASANGTPSLVTDTQLQSTCIIYSSTSVTPRPEEAYHYDNIDVISTEELLQFCADSPNNGLLGIHRRDRVWDILCNRNKDTRLPNTFLYPKDIAPIITALIDYHPDLECIRPYPILRTAYVESVLVSIFSSLHGFKDEKISFQEFRTSNLVDAFYMVTDMSTQGIMPFSVEYFTELCYDFNNLVKISRDDTELSKEDTEFFSNYYTIDNQVLSSSVTDTSALSPSSLLIPLPIGFVTRKGINYWNENSTQRISKFMLERVLQGIPRRLNAHRKGFLNFIDMVWFVCAVRDRMFDSSINYWFKCIDADDDGYITANDVEAIFIAQIEESGVYYGWPRIKKHNPNYGKVSKADGDSTTSTTIYNNEPYSSLPKRGYIADPELGTKISSFYGSNLNSSTVRNSMMMENSIGLAALPPLPSSDSEPSNSALTVDNTSVLTTVVVPPTWRDFVPPAALRASIHSFFDYLQSNNSLSVQKEAYYPSRRSQLSISSRDITLNHAGEFIFTGLIQGPMKDTRPVTPTALLLPYNTFRSSPKSSQSN